MITNYGNYAIVGKDGEEQSLCERLYLWNTEPDRDRLLLLLVVKGLQADMLTEQDLHDAGFLTGGQKIVFKG